LPGLNFRNPEFIRGFLYGVASQYSDTETIKLYQGLTI